jgi:RNA-directed DNA polymerase
MVLRQTMRRRMLTKLKAVKEELWRRMHHTIPEQGAYLRAVVMGHVRYYGVPLNGWSLGAFRQGVGWLWCRTLRRRSQQHRLPWQRMRRYIDRWLPPAHVCHAYPWARFDVLTQGRSAVR